MAGNTSPIFTAAPKVAGVQFTSTDTTTKKTLVSGGTNGTRIESVFCSTNDTAAVALNFYINDGTTDFYIGVVNLTAGAGYTTVTRVDALTSLGLSAFRALFLPTGYSLKVDCNATMTSAKTTDVVAMGGDF